MDSSLRAGEKRYDATIAGAGPVGLFLACELAMRKCSVLILEREASPKSPLKHVPFGIRGLSAPTIESLDRRGLLDQLELHKRLKNPHKTSAPDQGPRRQGGHFAGIPFLDGNIDSSQWKYRLPSSTDPSLITEMAEIEGVLLRRAEALGVEIRRGLPITNFQQSESAVTVWSGDESFESKWLVGCDGSRSVVRKVGGFEFAGTEPEFTGYSGRVEILDPEKLQQGRVPTDTGMYLRSQADYLVMVEFDGGSGHGVGPVTRERFQDVLRRVSGTDVTIKALEAGTTWTDRARQATTYRKGRVLLAGDAAHIHSPLGGQGLNLGLGDAMNLGWKLAATIRGEAPDGLLDSYEAERYPLGVRVLDWSRAQVAIMRPDPASRAVNAIVRDLIETRDGATYFAGRIWGVSTRYDLGEGHPLVGFSMPNFQFEDGRTVGELLRDGAGILFDFEGEGLFAKVAERFGVSYFSGRVVDSLGIKAALVRPDGIVGWASDGREGKGVEKAIGRWFGGVAN